MSVHYHARFSDPGLLTNLDALAALTSVGGNLGIRSNDALTNLDGLAGITSVGGLLYVLFNTVLTEFCGLFPLLNAGGLGWVYGVTGNATNPTEAEIIAGGACPALAIIDIKP